MWAALAAFAAQLGVPFLYDQINKIIDQNKSLSTNEATILANRILNAAEKKGSSMLNKAMMLLNNIPVISGSPALKQYLAKATDKAQQNYEKVEKAVADMKSKAQEKAANVSDYANRSIFSSIKDRIETGKTDLDRAKEQTDSALNKIERQI